MPPLDPSIPLGIQQPQSPLASIQQPLQTAQGLLALRQNTMQLNANQAISQAYSQSINPDGSVDFNKLQSMAAQNGAGAFLPQFMGQVATQRNQQQQYDTSLLDMHLKQQQNIRGMIGSLMQDPDLGKADMSGKIAGQISSAVQAGTLPLDRAIAEIRAIPQDPQAQAAWIKNHFINSLSGEAQLQAMMPQNVTVDTGQGTALFNRNPMSGEMTPNGFVQHGMTPAELAAPKTITMPDGSQRQVTTAQWLQMQGGGGGAGPGGAPSAPGGYTGRNDGSGTTGGAPGTLSALSPAQQAAATAEGTSSNTAAQELHNAAADAPMRLNLLQNARDALEKGVDANGNPITTGPGSDWKNTAESFVNTLSPGVAKALGITGQVQSYDEFKKILTNYASSVSGSLGTGTDARLNAAVTGNANPGISNLANEDILAKTMAAEKMRAAQDYAFQNSGLSTDQFNKWQSQWNKEVNPEAFVFTSMNPAQQQAFLARQSPAELTQFKADLGKLVRAHVISMPTAQSAPAPQAPQAQSAPLPASGVPQ
jgi:hypothetical protein